MPSVRWRARVAAAIPGVLLVVAVCFQQPLTLWLGNYSKQLDMAPVLLLATASAVVLAVAAAVVSRISGLPGRFMMAGAALLAACFYHWAGLAGDGTSTARFALALAIVVLAVFGVMRAALRGSANRWFTALALVLLGVPVVQLASAAAATRPSRLPVAADVALPARATAGLPDIYVVVLDGYARDDVLQQLYGASNEPFIDELRQRGFVVPDDARANYSMTYASIASTFAMEYPVREGSVVGKSEQMRLYQITGGDNPVVRSLVRAGYRYVHLEGGVSETRCGANVDECYESPIPDSLWAVLERTPLRSVIERRWGYFMTVDARDRFDRLHELANRFRRDRVPQLVFAHVVVPHAPLFLKGDCALRIAAALRGDVVGAPYYRPVIATRRAAYVEQLRCVNRQILSFLDRVGADAVVALTADHGPDSLEQIWTDIDRWTPEAVAERMAIFSAYKMPASCASRLPAAPSPVNLFRVVIGCVFEIEIPMLENRQLLVTRAVRDRERTIAVPFPAEVTFSRISGR